MNTLLVGFKGDFLSGKTSTAEGIAGKHVINLTPNRQVQYDIKYSTTALAAPIYKMFADLTKIEGEDAQNRKLWAIHDTLVKAFGTSPIAGAPSFDDFYEMVYEICAYPVEQVNPGKPREFLTYVATDICRALNPDCWINYHRNFYMGNLMEMWQKDIKSAIFTQDDLDEYKERSCLVNIISDVRFQNEVDYIKSRDGLLVEFVVDLETQQERSRTRDQQDISPETLDHQSEIDLKGLDPSLIDMRIDSNEFDFKSQVAIVKNYIEEKAIYRCQS